MSHIFYYWGGILIYAAIVIFIGWRSFQNRDRADDSSLEFWAAGQNLGGWSVGLSISASFMSVSWSCVYAIQLFYWFGVSALWLVPIPWLLTMLGLYIFTPRFRKIRAFSQPEMVARRFGEETRKYLALPVAFVFLVWGGAEIYAAAQILTPLLQAPFQLVLAFIALVVATYSYMGGFSAVVNTDKVQFSLVAFSIIAVAVIAWQALPDAGKALQNLPDAPKLLASPYALLALSPALIVMTMIAYLPGWLVETDLWVRLQAASSNSAARKGIVIASVNSMLFLTVLPLIIGLAALYLYPPNGAEIPARLQDGAAIIAVFLQDHAPVWLNILLTVGLAAAAMSTIDTCSHIVGLSLSYDLLEPMLKSSVSKRRKKNLPRLASALAVILAWLYALFTDSLWDIFYLSSGILTTTLFLPMLALFLKNVRPPQIKAAAAAGFITTLIFYFLESRGLLAGIQPGFISDTGLGYILWGSVGSLSGFILRGRA